MMAVSLEPCNNTDFLNQTVCISLSRNITTTPCSANMEALQPCSLDISNTSP